MKKLKFTCSNCQAKLRVPTHLAGVSAPCPKCGETITAPSDVTLAEEDESSAAGEEAIQKQPMHAGVGAQGAVSSLAAGVQQGAAVSNKAAVPSQQPGSRVVPSPPSVPTGGEEAAENVVPRPTYGQNIPVPIPPAPSPAELAEAALDAERAAAEVPPEVHSGEMPVSLDDIAPPEPVVQQTTPATSAVPETVAPPVTSPVAEVSTPKPIEETQPIRISSQPRHLPEPTNDPVPDGGDLPRLDVSLGAQHTDATAAEMLSPDGVVPREPTKVQLPSPGDASLQSAPDDFIIPGNLDKPSLSSGQGEVVQESVEPALEIPVDPSESDLVDLSAGQFESSPLNQQAVNTPRPEANRADQVAPVEHASVSDLLGLDGFEPNHEPPIDVASQSAGQPAQGPDAAVSPEQTEAPLHEPAQYESAVVPAALSREVPETFSPPVDQGAVEPPSQNPIAASTGSFRSEPTSSQAVPVSEKRSEADVLDDMFGGGESGGNFGLNIKLLIIAGAAVLATVAVFMFGNAMGGWSISDPVTTASGVKPITPEKAVEPEKPEVVLTPDPALEPSIDDAPVVVDPPAQDSVAEASPVRSTIAMPGDTSTPVKIMDSSGNLRDPVQEASDSIKSAQDSASSLANDAVAKVDSAALSFDEKVQSIVNGSGAGGGLSVIGGEEPPPALDTGSGIESAAGAARNYNPEPFYPAPTEEGSPLGKTHELIDAFLRAPDWETRLRYTYQGDSLKPAIQNYYQKWADRPVERFSLQLFQMESDVEMGGPYWVYLISTSDLDQGFPLIVRVEDGNLKVDWEIFSEFYDRHFVRFRSGEIPGPANFRLVIERMSDYYGADRDGFKDLDDYYVYQINPPYGELNEFSEYAFVKKDSAVAKSLDAVVGLGEEPLAVIISLDKSSFDHGIKHFVITDYVTEGWFR